MEEARKRMKALRREVVATTSRSSAEQAGGVNTIARDCRGGVNTTARDCP